MFSKMLQSLRNHWPIAVIFFAVLVLFKQNYIPGTFLTGWDNLHPEFNLGLNIQRSIFAVWQEYQGLGLLGGMGHASDLVRQLFLLFLSVFFPDNLLRYVWVFSTLFIGSTGAYFLSKFFLEKWLPDGKNIKLYALLAGLFYIFNLATIQTFYVPFEAFVAHFGFLPWLLLSSLSYFLGKSKRSLLFVSIILILATPAAYIPTLFIVYILSISILIGVYLSFDFSKIYIKRALKLLAIIVLINAFWLLPFMFFTLTSSHININAKINQMATETIFLQNKEFGDLKNVMLLKGFWFNNVDPNFQGLFTYMMNPWRDHLAKSFVQVIGYGMFLIVLIGLIKNLFIKKPINFALSALFLFAFTMLATATPPFSWIDQIFRIIPLFNQAFRFPFTKFSILTALTYAILFSFGMQTLGNLIGRKIKNINLTSYFLCSITIMAFIILVFPAFRLDLFYHKDRLIIPQEYFDTFKFFDKQDQNTRIANFPQHTFWGWNFYNWGYGGSGFPWYGIRQPMLDRAFDVWSPYNENYYWEITEALYSKDSKQLEDVLNKYQVSWLLLDKNVINPSAPKALFTPEFESLVSQITAIKKRQTFGNVVIYEVNLKNKQQSFVFNTGEQLSINKYNWASDDRAYASFGNYVTSEDNFSYFYPFRSLLSSKNQENHEYKARENAQTIEFTKELPDLPSNTDLLIPPLDTEEALTADIIAEKNSDDTFTLYAYIKTPQVSIIRKSDNKEEKVWEKSYKYPIAKFSKNITLPFKVNINGTASFKLNSLNKNEYLGSTYIFLKQSNTITVQDGKLPPETIGIDGSEFASQFNNLSKAVKVKDIKKGDIIKITSVKVNDNFSSFETWPSEQMKKQVGNCSNFRRGIVETSLDNTDRIMTLSSINSSSCVSFYIPTVDHSNSYISFIESKNVKGKPLHFWFLNEDQKFAPADTFVGQNKSMTPSYFVITPQEKFGAGYSLHLENISIGNDKTINEIGKISLYPIPYKFITSLVFDTKGPRSSSGNNSVLKNVQHPNESVYIAEYDPSMATDQTIILSQGYDKGWSAYEVKGKPNFLQIFLPFIFGKNVKNHVMVNNWENGWTMENGKSKNGQSIIIVYLPQYLQYLGFILTFGTLAFIAITALKRRTKNLTKEDDFDRLSEYNNSAPNERLMPRS